MIIYIYNEVTNLYVCEREKRGKGIQSSMNEKWPSDQSTIGEKDVGYTV